jgi:threonine/homoserine/homoserine lactone efflux protein
VIIAPDRYALFATAALVLLLVPGPSVLYVVTRSIHQGKRAGLVSVLGIHTGTLVHITGASAGLSALLVSSADAFTAVKLAGAAYLIGLGLWTIFSRTSDTDIVLGGERRLRRVYGQGVVVNVLNPKTALFFLAFLPQFVDPHRGHATLQIALLGLTFAALGLVTDSLWALGAGAAGDVLRRSRRFAQVQRYVSGAVFVGLGVVTALAGTGRERT